MLQADLRRRTAKADRRLVSALPAWTWRLHDLFGAADFLSALCLRLVSW
jgi:hypothetical protein